MNDLLLKLQVRIWDLWVRKDLEVVKTLGRSKYRISGIWLQDGRIFRVEDDFDKVV